MGVPNIAPDGPFTVTIEFHASDGKQVAKASYECPPGRFPAEDAIAEIAAETLDQIRDQLGEGFHWQTRHDFVQEAFAERASGVQFAIPGPNKWRMEWAK